MPATPVLVLVDPIAPADHRATRRAITRQRVISAVVGALIAAASAAPFLATLGH